MLWTIEAHTILRVILAKLDGLRVVSDGQKTISVKVDAAVQEGFSSVLQTTHFLWHLRMYSQSLRHCSKTRACESDDQRQRESLSELTGKGLIEARVLVLLLDGFKLILCSHGWHILGL